MLTLGGTHTSTWRRRSKWRTDRARHIPVLLTVGLLALCLALQLYAQVCCATLTPGPIAIPGIAADSLDYAFGAAGLLRGAYLVAWDGTARIPQYPPGFSILLLPAVAVGGVQAAVWITYLFVLVTGGLAALLAARLSHIWAAPLAVLVVLFAPAALRFGHLVMTEIPSVALALAELAFLAFGRRPAAAAAAGVLGGCLVWLRPATLVLLLAGLAAATARRHCLRWIGLYLLGAIPLLAGLALVQFLMFGSPLITGYQAVGHPLEPKRGQDLVAFFSLQWALGPPQTYDATTLGGMGTSWRLTNLGVYLLQFLGADGFVAWPGAGLVGLIGLCRLAPRPGAAGAVGRFGLVSVLVTLAVYVPYWYQSGRFLMIPAALIGIGMATLVTPPLTRFARTVRIARQGVSTCDGAEVVERPGERLRCKL